jgi:hypothetical protein
VEQSCDRWFILSAKHGLVDPEQVLVPYDEPLVGKPSSALERWATVVLQQLTDQLGEVSAYRFEIHAGAAYFNFGLRKGLRAAGAAVTVPSYRGKTGGKTAGVLRRGPSAYITGWRWRSTFSPAHAQHDRQAGDDLHIWQRGEEGAHRR